MIDDDHECRRLKDKIGEIWCPDGRPSPKELKLESALGYRKSALRHELETMLKTDRAEFDRLADRLLEDVEARERREDGR